jgi:hypothetical protein
MHSTQKRLLYCTLISVAIAGALVSLFALLELRAHRWTLSINVLSLVCVLLAVKTHAHVPAARGA